MAEHHQPNRLENWCYKFYGKFIVFVFCTQYWSIENSGMFLFMYVLYTNPIQVENAKTWKIKGSKIELQNI